MTNYVTGKLPVVDPTDEMKIAVGSLIASIQLKDLKDYIGSTGDSIELEDVTIPDDLVIYKDSPDPQYIPFTFKPIGASESVIVTDISTNGALSSLSYDVASRTATVEPHYAGREATILVKWGKGTKQFNIPVQEVNGGQNTHPDWALNALYSDLTVSDYETKGLQMTSREAGAYGGGVVTEISNSSLDDFTIDYNSAGDSLITIKPKNTGNIGSDTNFVVTVKLDDEVREVSFIVKANTQEASWKFSPNDVTVKLDDFVNTGVQTWARDSTGSGEKITWTTADNFDISNFEITANQNGSGLQTVRLKSKDSFPYGGGLSIHATADSDGSDRVFNIEVTR